MLNLLEHVSGNWNNVVKTAGLVILAWCLTRIVYNVYFHPLSKFPGPVLQRASGITYAWQLSRGQTAPHTQKLHERYGAVVRVSPNHLSFTDVRAWKDIYGHRIGSGSSNTEMPKSSVFYRLFRHIPQSIINAGRLDHQRLRRAMAHGFSDQSMREQEPAIRRYIDLLIQRFHENCGDGSTAMDVTRWYNWTTFDVVGDLVFAESFGCLSGSHYHPWIKTLFKSIRASASIVAMAYVGMTWVVPIVVKLGGTATQIKLRGIMRDMIDRRLAVEQGRQDLFEGVVKLHNEWDMDRGCLTSNAFVLVAAGSETTATTLSGITYLLLTNPVHLKRVTDEVRSAFSHPDEITISSVSKLDYMLACLNEALRMYPPVASNLAREVPAPGQTIAGVFVPAGTIVEIQHWSINHSEDNWVDPWTFNPDRFLSTQSENKLEALQAFSVGPRNCIGRNLAYAEMRLILARVLLDFDLKLGPDCQDWIERQRAYTIWDKVPLKVYFSPVRGHQAVANGN